MKRSPKYVALDVHQATTVASVREPGGRVIARSVVPTEARALAEYFAGMRGTVHVVFEEGAQAQWLHDLLRPLVDDVVVCNRRGSTAAPRPTWSTRTCCPSGCSVATCGPSTTGAPSAPRCAS